MTTHINDVNDLPPDIQALQHARRVVEHHAMVKRESITAGMSELLWAAQILLKELDSKAELTPDVRASAAEALRHKLRGVIPAIWLIDGEIWTEAIDVVVAVVAPQIARPLQARIAELEDASRNLVNTVNELAPQRVRDTAFDRLERLVKLTK